LGCKKRGVPAGSQTSTVTEVWCAAYLTRSRTRAQCASAAAADQDTGADAAASNPRKRKRPGSADSRGGSDTPAILADRSKAVQDRSELTSDTQEGEASLAHEGQPSQDLHYPAPEADVVSSSSYFMKNFFDRVRTAYEHAPAVSGRFEKGVGLKRDSKGLKWTHNERLWIPDVWDLKKECNEAVHVHPYAGHYGVDRTYHKLKEIFYWPNMVEDVKHYVASCDSCQRMKAHKQKKLRELHPLDIPGRRWESVSMDLITDLPRTDQGYDTIVVFVDRLSKMVHLAPTTKTVGGIGLARLYHHHVVRLHGFPTSIVSDRDVRYRGFWEALHELNGVKPRKSTGMHPQTDGQTENANGVLEDTLRHYVGPFQMDWDKHLASAEFAMNNAWNSSVRNTPFMLNYGQHPHTPATLEVHSRNPAVNAFVGKWSQQIARAKQCLVAAQDRQKASADKKRQPAPVWKPGTLVLLSIKHFRLQTGLRSKLAPRYVGPFKVLECIGPAHLSYRLDLPTALSRMHNVFHVSSLKEYRSDGSYQPPVVPEIINGECEWLVEYISSKRGKVPVVSI
jgi:hypothetical protein